MSRVSNLRFNEGYEIQLPLLAGHDVDIMLR
jgi:hypothetical protein